MNLNDLQSKTLTEALNEMDLAKYQIHSNDEGEVFSIEVKYIPKKANCAPESKRQLPILGPTWK